jgi:hypothetical protein
MAEWVIPAVTQLLIRKDTLSDDDITALGPSTAARIMRLRQNNVIWYCLDREFSGDFTLDPRFHHELESFK